jgi:excisionase family DNA binding protein
MTVRQGRREISDLKLIQDTGQDNEGPPSITGRLLRVSEVADTLSVSRSTVYDLMKRGQLRYVQILGTRRIEPSALNDFIQASCCSAQEVAH